MLMVFHSATEAVTSYILIERPLGKGVKYKNMYMCNQSDLFSMYYKCSLKVCVMEGGLFLFIVSTLRMTSMNVAMNRASKYGTGQWSDPSPH